MTIDPLATQILTDWFGTDEARIAECAPRWYKKDPEWDAHLRAAYGEYIVAACAGRFLAWESTSQGSLALVVLLDQYSRNIYRGTPQSFAQDAAAREIARRAIANGFDQRMITAKRVFLYMPFMHSEQPADHERALSLFGAMASVDPAIETNLNYAHQHKAIIDRFGRYPHRNELLGRQSTAEEIAFLGGPGSSF